MYRDRFGTHILDPGQRGAEVRPRTRCHTVAEPGQGQRGLCHIYVNLQPIFENRIR